MMSESLILPVRVPIPRCPATPGPRTIRIVLPPPPEFRQAGACPPAASKEVIPIARRRCRMKAIAAH